MNKTFKLIILLCALLASQQTIKAQIGYQVSLLNTATGEPQANKTVNVNITITNAEEEVVHTEIQTATTNDFGILSLSVGNKDTFKDADWNKLPFYIAVSADGTLIGKSQILTVPVAEYAKTAGAVLTKEMLIGTWKWGYTFTYPAGENINGESITGITKAYYTYTFKSDGTGTYQFDGSYPTENGVYKTFTYNIVDRHIYLYEPIENNLGLTVEDKLIESTSAYALFQILNFIPNENKITTYDSLLEGILLIKD